MEADNQVIHSQFVVRFASLPIVHSVWNRASTTYSRVKQSNTLLDYTISSVEKSVLYASDKAKPIVKKFENQINSADNLACRGLDKLEQTVPAIKISTEKILQDTKTFYNSTVQTGRNRLNDLRDYRNNKVNAVKEYGSQRASDLLTSEYGKLFSSSVDGALTLTESCVDFYLPPADEDDKVDKKAKPVLERMSYISTVVHRRARKLAMMKIQELKSATGSVIPAIDLSGRIDTIKALPVQAYSSATWLWSELNKVPEPVAEGDHLSLQQQAWTTARQMTHGLVNTCTTTLTSVQRIPEHIHLRLNSAYSYTVDIYTTVQKIPPQELPLQLLTQVRTALSVDQHVASAIHVFSHLPAIQWLLVTAYDKNTTNQDLFSEDEIFDRKDYLHALDQ